MSRSKHPRGRSKKYSAHLRKNKEWKHSGTWKPVERIALRQDPVGNWRITAARLERRSPRTRLKK